MRSVQVHLIRARQDDVRAVLSAFARHQAPDQWLYPLGSENPTLYIEFFTDFSCYESDDLAILERALGRLPEVSVIADVSGRVPGDLEVRAFVEFLLTRFEGVADDEFADHCWTLAEILSGA